GGRADQSRESVVLGDRVVDERGEGAEVLAVVRELDAALAARPPLQRLPGAVAADDLRGGHAFSLLARHSIGTMWLSAHPSRAQSGTRIPSSGAVSAAMSRSHSSDRRVKRATHSAVPRETKPAARMDPAASLDGLVRCMSGLLAVRPRGDGEGVGGAVDEGG